MSPALLPHAITPSALKAAGYQTYPERLKAGCVEAWYRTILSAEGKKQYLIYVAQLEWSPHVMEPELEVSYRWSIDAPMFVPREKHPGQYIFLPLAISPVDANLGIEEVEAFYAKTYAHLGAVPNPTD